MANSRSELNVRHTESTSANTMVTNDPVSANNSISFGVPLNSLNPIDNQDGLSLTRQEINRLILEYLVVEGYKDVAEKFSRETGITEPLNDVQAISSSLSDRMWIREAVLLRKIEDVIDTINRLWPELFDKNPFIYFQVSHWY